MKPVRCAFMIMAATLSAVLSAPLIYAGPGASTESKQDEQQAMDTANRMAAFLTHAKSFSVDIDAGFDAVQSSGQKIEFGETRHVVLNRPHQLRIDETKRDGSQSRLIYNGTNIAFTHLRENVYAMESKPGTIDEMIEYLVNTLDMRLPLAEIFSTRLPERLAESAKEAAFVETSSIAGIACDHLALRGDKVDLQLWVARGAQPLPLRLVITYKQVDGSPQFWAQFSNWNLSPKISPALFEFIPPSGATKIAFSLRQVTQPDKAGMKGRK